MFDADRPIETSEQDKLKRSVFAKYLARCLLDHQDTSSLVVGIEGGWGAGKSSVLNLTKKELKFAASNLIENEQPILIHFDPWQQADQTKTIEHFFKQLNFTFSEQEFLQDKNHILEALQQYMQHLELKPKTKKIKQSWFRKNNTSKTMRDTHHAREILQKLLLRLPRKIIITIDNLSRLQAAQIHSIFQIIKSLFNFENTIFLVVYDKKQLTDKLHHSGQNDSHDLIEKIIQLPFHIPTISEEEIHLLLEDKLQCIMCEIPEGIWNKEYWADIYLCYLRGFFKQCRDITRYINTLSFSYTRVKETVNPVDFFAITALEVFLPEIYAGIRNNKDLFSDLVEHVYEYTPNEIAEDKMRCDAILSLNNKFPKNLLINLLMTLFPRLRHIYQPEVKFYHSDQLARQSKRICSPDMFEIYFRMFLTDQHIHHKEFQVILTSDLPDDEFDHLLTRLNQDERALAFLDNFDVNTIANIPKNNIPQIINGLIDNADLFPQEVNNPLALNTSMRIHRILHSLLQRYVKHEDRFTLLQNAFSKAQKSLYSIIHEITEQQYEHHQESDTFLPEEFCDLTLEQLDSLKGLAVSKIKQWAHNNSLQDHPALLAILTAWHEWGDPNECREYIDTMTATDKGLVAFLVSALDKAINQAMTHYEHNPLWDQYLNDINILLPCYSLENHAREIFEDGYFEKLREKEQLAIMIFLDLIKANTKKEIPNTTGKLTD